MHFHLFCMDGPDGKRIRKELLKEHLAHIERVLPEIYIAGPVLDPDGGHIGSMLVVEAADAAAARKFLEADPYFKAGLWNTIAVARYYPAAGSWVGGATW